VAIELRDYQQRTIGPLRAALARDRRVVYVSPTGSGKGFLLAWLAAAKQKRVLIVVHRRELVAQTAKALAEHQLAVGIIAAGHAERPEFAVQIAMVSTLTRPERLARWAGWDPALMLFDESHHLITKSWGRLIKVFPHAYLIGFTATPLRLDGKGLGRIFKDMVVGATVKELIADGYLSPVVHFAPPSQLDLANIKTIAGDFDAEEAAERMRRARLAGDAIQHYQNHIHGPAIAYACTIAHSRELAAEFCDAGIRAVHVDAGTKEADRAVAVAGLGNGEVDIIFNVGLFTEGLDVPVLAGVLLLRPTKSLSLYLQMCGRALRVAPGKDHAVILDHAKNVFEHGMVDDDQVWSLADRSKRKAKKTGPVVRKCPSCAAIIPAAARICPHCDAVLVPELVIPDFADGELQPVDPVMVTRQRIAAMPRWRQLEWAAGNFDRLRLIAEVRGYQPGWAYWEQQRTGGGNQS
jgi:superfamily II DNA or RNA helicase